MDGSREGLRRRGLLGSVLAAAGVALGARTAPGAEAPGGNDILTVGEGGMMLQPGTYRASRFRFTGNNIRLVAAIPGSVEILIDDGRYFVERATQVHAVTLDGLRFRGGAGVLHLTYTGPNVTHPVTISRCEFYDYTVCAIANNSDNHPWLRVRECRFRCARGADAIGIAWGGYVDCSLIELNLFGWNRYHVKIGPRLSGTIWIRHNDFIMPSQADRRADIWFVPNSDDPPGRNAGTASFIEQNKFGNELQAVGAPRVLIAPEDEGTGTDRATRSHDPAWPGKGTVSGLTIAGNRIASIHRAGAPFLRSCIPDLRGLTWSNNKFDGGLYDHAVAFAGDPAGLTRAAPLRWKLDLSRADGASLPLHGFSSHPVDGGMPGWK